jgi:phosphopantothenoylcysteine decarboxylase / phosphopantothenate---cysteine ligase
MRVAVGVTGGVAAYKAAELVRRLQQQGLEVEVVMTRHATEFIAPLTFAALTGRKVITEMFSAPGAEAANVESAIEHIAVAQRIDALAIAPATADIIAKLAQGLADDFLTTLYLATTVPVIIAPAMNVNMWEHTATQANLTTLRARGVRVVSPEEGYLACGLVGAGRMAGVEAVAQAIVSALGLSQDLAEETLLVTAGPTCEDIDPIRYLTNHSSGKMGYAIAEAAQRRGARVILVSGPVALAAPFGVELVSVRTAEDMQRAVRAQLEHTTAIIMAAAVSDFRPAAPQRSKIKRGVGHFTLELESTPDILAEVAAEKSSSGRRRILIGFAAETENLAEHARHKLQVKGLDLVVANDVTQPGAGFELDTNIVTLYFRDFPPESLPQMSKFEVASRLLDELLRLRHAPRLTTRSAEPQGQATPRK